MRADYDVPPPTEANLKMATYLIPPPPRPLVEPAQTTTTTIQSSPMPPTRFPNLAPRPPPKAVRPFECREFNPPASQLNLAEDLGRIMASEEPDVMEQTPILLPKSLLTTPDRNRLQLTEMRSTYIEMSPM